MVEILAVMAVVYCSDGDCSYWCVCMVVSGDGGACYWWNSVMLVVVASGGGEWCYGTIEVVV